MTGSSAWIAWKSTYGTSRALRSLPSCRGFWAKERERYPEMATNSGMWNAYTQVSMISLLAELTVRSRCPTTTSVIRMARALSMYGSRGELCPAAAGRAVSVVMRGVFLGVLVGGRLCGAGAPAGRLQPPLRAEVAVTPPG